jgi:hypothetical protein
MATSCSSVSFDRRLIGQRVQSISTIETKRLASWSERIVVDREDVFRPGQAKNEPATAAPWIPAAHNMENAKSQHGTIFILSGEAKTLSII